jgi:hypothetical protein
MNDLALALGEIGRRLDAAGLPWALLGGLAVSVRSEPRFTRDIDLAVSVVGDAQAEALVRQLRSVGYQVLAVVEQEATGRLATVRLAPPGEADDAVVTDLLFASSGIEAEIVVAAEPLEVFPGIVAPVARSGHLLALKVLARDDLNRPQDLVDARALLVGMPPAELLLARTALDLIAERGFHRHRRLAEALESLLEEIPPGDPK